MRTVDAISESNLYADALEETKAANHSRNSEDATSTHLPAAPSFKRRPTLCPLRIGTTLNSGASRGEVTLW
jgi:hypothetical protein